VNENTLNEPTGSVSENVSTTSGGGTAGVVAGEVGAVAAELWLHAVPTTRTPRTHAIARWTLVSCRHGANPIVTSAVGIP